MSYMCLNTGRSAPFGPPDPDGVPCCEASAYDADDCSCWTPVYAAGDLDPPRLEYRSTELQEGPPAIRPDRCQDCAYKRDSPEWKENGGAPPYGASQRFYCHDGMPLITGWMHPSGVVRPSPDPTADFDPIIRGDRTWKADGSPAILCAGWAAHNYLPRPKARQP